MLHNVIKTLGVTAVVAVPLATSAFAQNLSDQQIAGINRGVLDVVSTCSINPSQAANEIQRLAFDSIVNNSQAAQIAGSIIAASQAATESPSCLFAVGEGLTRWALSFGASSATALSIGTVLGQDGETPIVNACVNIAGVQTDLGLACDPSTGDISVSRERRGSAFVFGDGGETDRDVNRLINTGEDPGNPSPN